jgi:hypothetical protein
MYTKDELLDLTAAEVREIAESIGIEYTTKSPTIDAILGKQDAVVNDVTPVESDLFTPVVKPSPPVTPVVKETPTVVATPPSGYYAKLGIPLGNDGDKIRHRLDGTRIN